MEITDAQAHIWAAPSFERPWPAEGAAYAHGTDSFTVEHLLDQMAAAGVDSAVLVPPSFEGDYNDVCLGAAQRFPEKFAVMGRISLDESVARGLVPEWLGQPGMHGIRLTFSQPHQRDRLAEGHADWLFAEAAVAGIPIAMYAPGLTEYVRAVAIRHPDLRLIIDHLGIRSDLRDDHIDRPISEVMSLADLPNIAVKATALPCVVTEQYPFPSLHGRIRRVIDAFGPERVFWGCDISRLPCTYREAITYVTEEMGLDEDVLDWIMGRGIRTWIRWQP